MQELKLIGVEDRDLILAGDDGATYRLVITPTLESAVRAPRATPRPHSSVSPREVQALLRSGLTVEQVAEQLDADLEDVRRFEAPITAELQYMVDAARDVALRLPDANGADAGSSFGEIMDARLADRHAEAVQWSSWKDEHDWYIQLEYVSGGVNVDARWVFDAKLHTLSPANDDARSISSEDGTLPTRATRLRAVLPADATQPAQPTIYDVTLDEGDLSDESDEAPASADPELPIATVTSLESRRPGSAAPAASDLDHSTTTEDLLQALRQHRGERQPAPVEPEVVEQAPVRHTESSSGPSESSSPVEQPPTPARSRNSRPAMPSWDEIVFGSKGSNDTDEHS